MRDSYGWYNRKWNNQPAYIVLLVDNLVESYPAWVLRLQFFRALMLSDTLYHEIGHHIHATQVPEYKEREDVADDWAIKLSRRHFWRKHWYIMMILYPLRPIIRAVKRYFNKNRGNR
jgi:hypothetical protein